MNARANMQLTLDTTCPKCGGQLWTARFTDEKHKKHEGFVCKDCGQHYLIIVEVTLKSVAQATP